MYSKADLDSVLTRLSKLLDSRSVILGIGNTLRQDDGFGSSLAKNLKGKIKLKVWDAGTSPENFLGVVVKQKPSTVLFVDAVDFGGEPSDIRLFDSEEVRTRNFFTTHDTSLTMLFDFLKKEGSTELFLLAVQPKSIGFGETMSQEVEKCLQEFEIGFLKRVAP